MDIAATAETVAAPASQGATIAMLVVLWLGLTVSVFLLIALWKVYRKAGLPGWGVLVPIYNVILLLRIGGKPGWWFLLLLLAPINVIFHILMLLGIARNFGKGGGFAVGLLLLPVIFFPILAFGNARWNSASA